MSIEPLRPLLPATIHVVEPEVLDAEIVEEDVPLPTINILPEHEAVTRAIALLVSNCQDVYVRDAALVRVVRPVEPHAEPTIAEVGSLWLRDRLSRLANFCRRGREGLVPCPVPDWLAPMVQARRDFPGIRPLTAVVETPIFTADGQVHRHSYDAGAAVLVLPKSASTAQSMPASPTIEDARKAAAKLFGVVQDFPFATSPAADANRAAWLALVMGIAARHAIAGPVPFGLVDASSQSSGKGLLVQVTSLIATGRHASITQCSGENEELRRSLLSVLRDGRRIGWLDEVPSPFGGREWNALCTAWPTYSDRVVGSSVAPALPTRACWLVSGNNVLLDGDSTRRALIVRLEPAVERPESRDDFHVRDLLAWVKAHQPELLEAALTILAAFHLAGRPRVIKEPIGSFEAWDSLVRQAVAWVTGQDCMAPRQEMAALVDRRRTAWTHMAQALWGLFGEKCFTAKLALEALAGPKGTEAGRQAVEELLSGKSATVRSWGLALSRHRGVIARGLRLDIVNPHGNEGVVYRLTDTRRNDQARPKEDSHGEA